MKNKRRFTVPIIEGDAIIHIKSDKTVSLVFAEDGDTIAREMSWPDHEVYKTAVQFALMIDSYFKNGEGLDSIILHSPTGNIAAELLGKELLQISLAGVGDLGELEVDNAADDDTAEQEGKDIYSGKTPDNVLDLTEKLKKSKEDNEKE
tara:strand:- start:160 stop:606 length:447 start_codon:yes stop_codon:yes gene_type:complete